MKYPKKAPFTMADLTLKNPELSRHIISKIINKEYNRGKLHRLGKTQKDGRKEMVYATVPLSSLRGKMVDNIYSTHDHLTKAQEKFVEKVFTPKVLKNALKETCKRVRGMIRLHTVGTVKGSRTGLDSDNFSTCFGSCLSDIITREFGIKVLVSGTDNRKPDLCFPHLDFNVEIKATTSKRGWLGGQESKRPYPTILISYDIYNETFFAAIVPKVIWPNHDVSVVHFYGPNFRWKEFCNNYPEKNILLGSITEQNRMIREAI